MEKLFEIYANNDKLLKFVWEIVPEVEEAYAEGEAAEKMAVERSVSQKFTFSSFLAKRAEGEDEDGMYFSFMTEEMKRLLVPNFTLCVWKSAHQMNPCERKIKNLIHQLRICAVTGEYRYLTMNRSLCREVNERWVERLADSSGKIRKDILYWTGLTLWYIFLLYESPYHSEKYLERTRNEMRCLMEVCAEKPEKPEEKKADENTDRTFPVRIKQYLDQRVFGQDEAKKTLTMAVVSFLKTGRRSPILLAGPTGCGKTFLLETLSQMPELKEELGFSYYCSTELTENGFHGDDMADLFKKVRSDFRHKDKGILFLDEIDKLVAYSSADNSGNDVNENIINQLLTAITGNKGNYCIDTNNILFIFGGAFENLEKEKKNQSRHAIGFMAPGNESGNGGAYPEGLNRADLFRKGSRQFWGRIGKIVVMNPLDRDSIRRIFEDEQYGVLVNKKREFAEWGLDLEWDESFVDAAIDQVASSDQGARCCVSLVERTIGTYDYDLCESGMSCMKLSGAVLKGEKPVCC